MGSAASGQDLVEYTWNGGTGTQQWQTAGNWSPATVPNDNWSTANVSGALGADLTVDVGTTGNDITVAGITMGDTSAASTTNFTSSGAVLHFDNDYTFEGTADFDRDKDIDLADLMIWQRGFGLTGQENNGNGDADLDTYVDGDDLAIWRSELNQPGMNSSVSNNGRAFISSEGVAGSVNTITTNIHLDDDPLDILGTRDLAIDGNITHNGTMGDEGYTFSSDIENRVEGGTVTINGDVNLLNSIDSSGGSLWFRSTAENSTLIINGELSDGSNPDETGTAGFGGSNGGVVYIPGANSYRGSTRFYGTVEIGNDLAFGTSRIRQVGTLVPVDPDGAGPEVGDRELANNMVLAQWLSFKGSHNVTLTGHITQTNNRGINNNLDAGKTLTLDGRIDIWEDDEEGVERELEIFGSGHTIISGVVRDIPDLDPEGNPWSFAGEATVLTKTGSGSLTIDVANGGDNNHGGETRVKMGYLHFASNDSLNSGAGLIYSTGGAVGVDEGVATNTAFMAKIDSNSFGGLMIPVSEAAANLNFTTTLANAGGMTVAAPETGLTYTGTITPANDTYGLGGGSATLTLPNAQLVDGTNPRSVEVRNGGTVQLWGDNTYTGSTAISTRYTHDENNTYYEEVAPVLEVDDLADGGAASSIGASSNAAENLFIQGSTLKYVGDGDSTDRLFTIGTGGATIDASGNGALVFTNTGTLGRDDAESRTGSLRAGAPSYVANVVYLLPDTSDLIEGMPVTDPDSTGYIQGGGCTGGAYCIPDDTTIGGVSSNGEDIGISNLTEPDVIKVNTRIVFGTVERTLTLDGSNTGNNTMTPIISDSDGFPSEPGFTVAPGVVSVKKSGIGKWILTGNNTYTGDTIIEDGILSITNAYLDDDAAVWLFSEIDEVAVNPVFDLDFIGTDTIAALYIDEVEQTAGTWGAIGSGAANESAYFTGTGILNVASGALGAVAVVPEPGALALAVLSCFVGYTRRRRVA